MFCARTSVSCRRFVIKVCWFSASLEHSLSTTTTIWSPWYPKAEISCKSCKTIQTDVQKFRFTERGSNLANPLLNNIHYVYNMQKEYGIQFYKTINKLLCNLSFAGQYIYILVIPPQTKFGGLKESPCLSVCPSVRPSVRSSVRLARVNLTLTITF